MTKLSLVCLTSYYLPNLFQDFFQYDGNLHGYNTRYASKKNLYISKVRTNSGKQTITYTATVLWDNILIPPKGTQCLQQNN